LTIPADLAAYHEHEAAEAAAKYVAALTTDKAATDWHLANVQARRDVIAALRESACLSDMAAAITANGGHVRVLRHILAPPISQDQFKLLCPAYSKDAENKSRPVPAASAALVAAAIDGARNRRLTRWIERGSPARPVEIRELLHAVSPLLSQQIVATVRRNRLSAEQEGAVLSLLESKGWSRMTSALIQTLSDVPVKHYMHKTRFATKTLPQEVDVACGLGKTVVLAMECKVTNDRTNSVKRINDILKKAKAWQDHWGSFVRTAALLQGVIGYKDVARLLDDHVEVFWSHRLDDFDAWIDANTSP
jgi:XamI restriction endonuclease